MDASFKKSRFFGFFHVCGDRLQSKTNERAGGVGSTSRFSPAGSHQRALYAAAFNLGSSSPGFRCGEGAAGRGLRCRLNPARTLMCCSADCVCCHSACYRGAHGHMHALESVLLHALHLRGRRRQQGRCSDLHTQKNGLIRHQPCPV